MDVICVGKYRWMLLKLDDIDITFSYFLNNTIIFVMWNQEKSLILPLRPPPIQHFQLDPCIDL